MKKWLVAVLVILALLVLIAPGIVGRLAEQNIEQKHRLGGKRQPGCLDRDRAVRPWLVYVRRHASSRPGWWALRRSDGRVPGDDRQRGAAFTYYSYRARSRTAARRPPCPPGLASTVSTFQIDPGNGQPIDIPGNLTSKLSLDGSSVSKLLLEADSHELDGATLEWEGVDLDITTDPGSGRITAGGEIKPWQIGTATSTADFSAMTVAVDQAASEYGIRVGSVSLEMGRVEIVDEGVPISVESISIQGESSIDGDRVNATSNFEFNTMTIPAVGEVSLNLDFALEGADAESARAISQAIEDAQASDDPDLALANLLPDYRRRSWHPVRQGRGYSNRSLRHFVATGCDVDNRRPVGTRREIQAARSTGKTCCCE